MSITIQHSQEALCLAHIQALAAIAGVNLAHGSVHDYGVDGVFRPVVIHRKRRVESGFPIDFQAKSTTEWEAKDGQIIYDLEAKNYNDNGATAGGCNYDDPGLALSSEEPGSLARPFPRCHRASALLLLDCPHRGEPTDNTATKRINIPQCNLFTPDSLRGLLNTERLRREGEY